jgi:8-oxo-dGTP pyrophosphatase MutT (NUDIX family)
MKFQFSAGGIVYKKVDGKFHILLGKSSAYHTWSFPKGLIGDKNKKESKEDAALREVLEETGITANIIHLLQPKTYWFQLEGVKIKKTVYYFMMEYISGETKDHDWEMEAIEWVPEDEVENYLTYPSDKTIWQEGREKLPL